MKVNSQLTGRGKLGNVVYALNGGECIAREKPASVANPSTALQVENRSSFKLLSQLSAALKNEIAIKKDGMKTARNQFMTINKSFVRVNDGVAQLNLNKVQLTKSNRGLVVFEADREDGTSIAVSLNESMAASIDRVVYVAYVKGDDGSLTLFDSKIVDAAGATGTFDGNLTYTDKSVVIYAYGIKDTTAAAKAAYGNMVAPTAEQVAKLLTTSSEAANGSQVTKTQGLTMLEGENTGSSDAEEHFVVSVTASGNGSVSGGGRFTAGQTCTLHATPDAEASFVAWKRGSASGETLSTNANYSFEVVDNIQIVGVFQGGPTPHYQINVSASPAGYGTVSGGGSKEEGSSCTVVASPASGKAFQRWTENGQTVSTSASYTFTVNAARTLVAVFGDQPSSGFSGVTIDGESWNSSKHIAAGSHTIAGTNTTQKGKSAALVTGSSKPTVGSSVMIGSGVTIDSSTGAFSLSKNIGAGTTYWLVAYHDTGDEQYIVDDAYDYSLVGSGD